MACCGCGQRRRSSAFLPRAPYDQPGLRYPGSSWGSASSSSTDTTTLLSGPRRGSLGSVPPVTLTLVEHVSHLADPPGQPPPCVFCSPSAAPQAAPTSHAPTTLSALTGGVP
ncbi:hypothetical protein E2C01_067027 [Portunus trituberculatus]|uniref:Uncharacterized protein n=1 Tax=Portunus trituberculatus TaxID=210409 RepID=A0A5B7HSI9_PORTR|nr:hypothetical protein [Portunus trituberculatus]